MLLSCSLLNAIFIVRSSWLPLWIYHYFIALFIFRDPGFNLYCTVAPKDWRVKYHDRPISRHIKNSSRCHFLVKPIVFKYAMCSIFFIEFIWHFKNKHGDVLSKNDINVQFPIHTRYSWEKHPAVVAHREITPVKWEVALFIEFWVRENCSFVIIWAATCRTCDSFVAIGDKTFRAVLILVNTLIN